MAEHDEEIRKPTVKMMRVTPPPPRRASSDEILAADALVPESSPFPPEPPTGERCPICQACALCRGTGMVTAVQKAAFESAKVLGEIADDQDELDADEGGQ